MAEQKKPVALPQSIFYSQKRGTTPAEPEPNWRTLYLAAETERSKLQDAINEHRKHHPRLTSNADEMLWWKAGLG